MKRSGIGPNTTQDNLQYALPHDADFLFEEEQDAEPARILPSWPHCDRLRSGSQGRSPNEWLSWVATLSTVEMMPVQRLIAHSFTVAPDRFAPHALKFLLEDKRRFALQSMHRITGTSSRLVEAVNGHWSARRT